MLRPLYDRTLALSGHKNADYALALISFIESSFFPVPPDVMLIPMVLAQRARAWMLAAICTLASAAGAVLGYAIGYFLWDTVGQSLVGVYGGQAAFDRFTGFYDSWGVWIVVAAAISFLPFKVATSASGVAGLAFVPFVLASLFGRAVRFFLVAGLVYAFGPQVRFYIERYFGPLSLAAIGLVLVGFIAMAGLGQ